MHCCGNNKTDSTKESYAGTGQHAAHQPEKKNPVWGIIFLTAGIILLALFFLR